MQPTSHSFGLIVGAGTLLFFMILVMLSIFDNQVPCESRFLISIVLALGASFSTALMGGSVALEGRVPRIIEAYPLAIKAGGGIAVFFSCCSLRRAFLDSKRIVVQQHYRPSVKFGALKCKYPE
jgi:cytochrome bd-type quinol oxidase subunit 1